MITPFNYNNITDLQKDTIKEVCRICEERGMNDFSNELKVQFQIVEREKYDTTQNKFVQKCQENGLHISYQGFMVENNVEYPMIALTGDLRDLEKLVE